MGIALDIRVVELLCGRLCHELISPVAAVNNGVEFLGEDDPEFVKEAMTLIGQSARRAGQRLQFYRFAYGTAGASAVADGSAFDGNELCQGLLEGGKARTTWAEAARGLPAAWQRLACNMVVVASEVLPRGGTIDVRPRRGRGGPGIEVAAEGDSLNVSAELEAVLAEDVAIDALTARTVHGYYTAVLARQLGVRLALAAEGGRRCVLTAG
jgi:histidine phosphotransferase ChpT